MYPNIPTPSSSNALFDDTDNDSQDDIELDHGSSEDSDSPNMMDQDGNKDNGSPSGNHNRRTSFYTSPAQESRAEYASFVKKRKLSQIHDQEIEKKESEVYTLKRRNESLEQELQRERFKVTEFEMKYNNERQRRKELRASYDKLLEKAKQYKNRERQEQSTETSAFLNSTIGSDLGDLHNTSTLSRLNDSFELQSSVEKKLFDAEDKIAQYEKHIANHNMMIETLRLAMNNKEAELKDLRSKLLDVSQKEKNYHFEVDFLKNELEKVNTSDRVLEKRLEQGSVDAELKFLKSELLKMQNVEKQNKDLITKNHELESRLSNELKLKEEIEDLHRRLHRVSELEHQTSSQQSTIIKLEQTLKHWQDVFGEKSPDEVLQEKNNLSGQVKRLSAKVEEICTENKILQSEINSANQEKDMLQVKLTNQHAEVTNLEQKLRDMDIKYRILEKENASNKSMLSSYDQEDAVIGGNTQKMSRIEQLEGIIAEKEAAIKTITEKCEILAKKQSESEREKEVQKIELERLKSNIQLLELENEKLKKEKEEWNTEKSGYEKELADYERRVGRGEYNKDNFKVLHMAINPETLAKVSHSNNELEVLRAENKILNDRLDKLEAFKSTHGSVSENALEFKEKWQQADKMNQRLKEAFQQQIKLFRTGIYRLFGFRVDIMDNTFRLTSMYGERQDDYLIFKNSDSGLELMESDYASQLEQHLLDYLNTYQSIPLFLSHITRELFNKQTVMSGLKLSSLTQRSMIHE